MVSGWRGSGRQGGGPAVAGIGLGPDAIAFGRISGLPVPAMQRTQLFARNARRASHDVSVSADSRSACQVLDHAEAHVPSAGLDDRSKVIDEAADHLVRESLQLGVDSRGVL